MKSLWIAAAVAAGLVGIPAWAAPSVRVPDSLVTPVKVVRHKHRTVTKTTTTRRVVHHHTTTHTSSATSGTNGAAPPQ